MERREIKGGGKREKKAAKTDVRKRIFEIWELGKGRGREEEKKKDQKLTKKNNEEQLLCRLFWGKNMENHRPKVLFILYHEFYSFPRTKNYSAENSFAPRL